MCCAAHRCYEYQAYLLPGITMAAPDSKSSPSVFLFTEFEHFTIGNDGQRSVPARLEVVHEDRLWCFPFLVVQIAFCWSCSVLLPFVGNFGVCPKHPPTHSKPAGRRRDARLCRPMEVDRLLVPSCPVHLFLFDSEQTPVSGDLHHHCILSLNRFR